MVFYVLMSLFSPFISFLIAGFFSNSKKSYFVGLICSILIILSTIGSFALLELVLGNEAIILYMGEFIHIGLLNVEYSFIIDELSAVMMVVVGIVSSVVHIYSIGYMEKDSGFNRYFSYLGLFVFSMLILVTSDNFVGLFIGWEGVGLCSWLLIGFWYDRKNISWYANEAFIMNRIADLGLLLGIFLIYFQVGSLKYEDVFAASDTIEHSTLVWIGVLLFIGAMGKSAQFPFHTWLADAMAGPTPVSALIHAATMVTAGVYLVIRTNVIFSLIPQVGNFIVYLGAFVAVFAASMAAVHNDLKKIIAYSTLSQLGYMFVAAGFGAYWIALFHLMTHAFFKALLFLVAGNVMHAMKDELDIKKMGGLYKYMKYTTILTILASFALAGVWPFAGFFSKDKILEVAFNEANYLIWMVLLAGAVMTAFYSFRLIMLVFFGKQKFNHHPHEAKASMIMAMFVLGFLAVFSGFFEHKFINFTTRLLPEYEFKLTNGTVLIFVVLTLLTVIASIILTVLTYSKNWIKPDIQNSKIYKILSNQYYIPRFYEKVLIGGYSQISKYCAKLDEKIIDKSVDFVARFVLKVGVATNKMQSGNLSLMLRLMITGFIILMCFVFFIKDAGWIIF